MLTSQIGTAPKQDAASTGKRLGSNVVQEVLSYGAILRTFCNWYGIGYRWRITWDDSAGIYRVGIELYNRAGRDVMLRSTMRGVSNFSYAYDARDSVNAIVYSASTSWSESGVQDKDNKSAILGVSFDHGAAKNNAQVAEEWRSKFVDIGSVPDENDTSRSAAVAWVKTQSVADEMQTPTETISFDYDNSGMFRYGEHFRLGDRVTIIEFAYQSDWHCSKTNNLFL